MSAPSALTVVDAFDLPEWIGTTEVTWRVEENRTPTRSHHVPGRLHGETEQIACDLLATDQAWPTPVTDDTTRTLVHQAWHNGQVLLVEYDGRLALAVPGTGFNADRILDALARLAKAVGAAPEHFVAALRLGVMDGHG